MGYALDPIGTPISQPAPAPAPPPPSSPIPPSTTVDPTPYLTPSPIIATETYTIGSMPLGYYESAEYANRIKRIARFFEPRPVAYPKIPQLNIDVFRERLEQTKFKIRERFQTFLESLKPKYQNII